MIQRVLADEIMLVCLCCLFEGGCEPLTAHGLADASNPFVSLDPDKEPVALVCVNNERLDNGYLHRNI